MKIIKFMLFIIMINISLANNIFYKVTPKLKKMIIDNTGIIINNNIKYVGIYNLNGFNHYILLNESNIINSLEQKINKLYLSNSTSSIQYPIKKYYIHIFKKIKQNGYIDLEYEIMLARSFDGDLGAKNKKYLNVLLDSGAGINSGGIGNKKTEHIYTYPELDSPLIIGSIGDIFKNITLNVTLNDPDNQIIIDNYLPENINPETKTTEKSTVAIDFRNVTKFSIPLPLPNWKWEHDFSYNTAMYNIISKAHNNVLSRDFVWELSDSLPLIKWSYKNSQSWSCDIMFIDDNYNCPTYNYFDKDKLNVEGYLYDMKPKFLIRFSADPEYNGKSELYLNTSVTTGALLGYAGHEHFYNIFHTVRALYDKATFQYNELEYKINTLYNIQDIQHLTIDWSSPVFEQYYPTTYKFIKDNLCLTNKNNIVIAEKCLSSTDINYNSQKWLFDSENKLIKDFNNYHKCIQYKDNIFQVLDCDNDISDNLWFNKKPNEENYTLYYKDQYLDIKNKKIILAPTHADIIVKLDNY